MRTLTFILFIVMLLQSGCRMAVAQTDADSLITSIEKAIAEKDWTKAKSGLDNLEKICRKECINRYNFTAAYYSHQVYLSDPIANVKFFDTAVAFYTDLIKGLPQQDAAYRNLALLYGAAGRQAECVRTLQDGLTATNNAYFWILLGDSFLRSGDIPRARDCYAEAAEDDNTREDAYERTVKLFRQEGGNPETILKFCKQTNENGFTRLSIRCLADLMNKCYLEKPEAAEAALVWWTYLTAKKSKTPDVGVLPKEWSAPLAVELKAIVQYPSRLRVPLSWENAKVPVMLKNLGLGDKLAIERNFLPRNVVAMVFESTAKRLVNQDSVVLAEQILVNAYDMMTEHDVYHYVKETEMIPDVFFKIAGDLGSLYTQNPELPQANYKFGRLVHDLFEGKNQAYLDRLSNEGVMKFHTTLGMIYAERKEWTGGGITNGIFQLNSAISKSPEGKNTGYLNLLLAEGYRSANRRQEEAQTLLNASEHFLNDDDLGSAHDALIQYRERDFSSNARQMQIADILKFRMSIESAAVEVKNYDTLIRTVDKLTIGPAGASYFAKLQRFKLLSDLGTLAKSSGKDVVAFRLHSNAIEQGYKLRSLGNTTDIARLNAQKSSVLDRLTFKREPSDAAVLNLFTTREVQGKHSWTVYENDGFDSRQVSQSNAVLAAAKVGAVLKMNEREWANNTHDLVIGDEIIYYKSRLSPLKDEMQKAVADLNYTMLKL